MYGELGVSVLDQRAAAQSLLAAQRQASLAAALQENRTATRAVQRSSDLATLVLQAYDEDNDQALNYKEFTRFMLDVVPEEALPPEHEYRETAPHGMTVEHLRELVPLFRSPLDLYNRLSAAVARLQAAAGGSKRADCPPQLDGLPTRGDWLAAAARGRPQARRAHPARAPRSSGGGAVSAGEASLRLQLLQLSEDRPRQRIGGAEERERDAIGLLMDWGRRGALPSPRGSPGRRRHSVSPTCAPLAAPVQTQRQGSGPVGLARFRALSETVLVRTLSGGSEPDYELLTLRDLVYAFAPESEGAAEELLSSAREEEERPPGPLPADWWDGVLEELEGHGLRRPTPECVEAVRRACLQGCPGRAASAAALAAAAAGREAELIAALLRGGRPVVRRGGEVLDCHVLHSLNPPYAPEASEWVRRVHRKHDIPFWYSPQAGESQWTEPAALRAAKHRALLSQLESASPQGSPNYPSRRKFIDPPSTPSAAGLRARKPTLPTARSRQHPFDPARDLYESRGQESGTGSQKVSLADTDRDGTSFLGCSGSYLESGSYADAASVLDDEAAADRAAIISAAIDRCMADSDEDSLLFAVRDLYAIPSTPLMGAGSAGPPSPKLLQIPL
eukprot:TRINITY_DN10391_c0_g1_i1.p1 TRINITY_DN10391_c0_g1~~TRINITY_DN10391_c0_g1_i1.p1  ORF type:complete len:647 (+),score=174.11 TRINITY_DN10391_c0_g1_i1:87-1943(+)